MKKNCKKSGLFFWLIFISFLMTHLPVVSSDSIGYASQEPPILSELIPGDIIFMDLVNGGIIENNPAQHILSNDHVVLYIGERSDALGIWCFSAGLTGTAYGVDFVPLANYTDPDRYENLTIGRVITANQTQRDNAIKWAIERRYADYQRWFVKVGFLLIPRPLKCANPNNHNIPTANQWYCSELVWAAYYNTSNRTIDIDTNGWRSLPWVIPSVNMGVPVPSLWPEWIRNLRLPLPSYAYKNEIQMDDDILLIPWM